MSFGILPAPEEFQRRPIFDDILVYGVGETQAEALCDHDVKIRALFKRCSAKGIKLNKEKLKLRQKEVKFIRHVISVW